MIGIGTIKIMMFDSVVRILCTLCDVRHVPNLRRSLISVGSLCNLGLKQVIENDSLKIANDSLIEMKWIKAENQYLPKSAAVVVQSPSVVDFANSDTTRL